MVELRIEEFLNELKKLWENVSCLDLGCGAGIDWTCGVSVID